jgi:hypothetical protein
MLDEMGCALFIGFVFMYRTEFDKYEKCGHREGMSYRLVYIFEPIGEYMGSYHL